MSKYTSMAVEPITEVITDPETISLTWDGILKLLAQNVFYILLLIGVIAGIIIAWVFLSKMRKEEDRFLEEYKRVKKDLESTAPKPGRVVMNMFEGIGIVLTIILGLVFGLSLWLLELRLTIVFVLIMMLGFVIFEKLGLFSAYTTQVFLVSNDSTKFLGYHITDNMHPKGWRDFLITKSKWMKKPEVVRVNAKGKQKIKVYEKKKIKRGGKMVDVVEEKEDIIDLPTDLVKFDKSNKVVLIKGRDVRTYRYFKYVIHTNKNNEPIDWDKIISIRDIDRMIGDHWAQLADDWRDTSRRLIGSNPEVVKAQKMGTEGIEEELI